MCPASTALAQDWLGKDKNNPYLMQKNIYLATYLAE